MALILKDGNIPLRAGSMDYIPLQLTNDDGTTPIDLSSAIKVELRFKGKKDKEVKIFSSDDDPQKLFVTDEVNVILELRQESTEFPDAALHGMYIIVYDEGGKPCPVPDGKTPDGKKYNDFRVIK